MGDYYTNFTDRADDMYFSALYDEEEIFPISDEKYAGELQLQEVLISATMSFSLPSQPPTNPPPKKRRSLIAPTACCSSSQTFCKICMEAAPLSDMFENNNCPHVFCCACLSQHIEAKLQENIAVIKCPEVQCKAVLEPEICRDIVPIGVFEKWERALCESMLLDAKKFYCPFEDCSVLLVDDAEEKVAQAECPSCRRMFCAQCKVVWHAGLSCLEFQSLDPNEKGRDDLILMELAKHNKWMRCPRCKFFVEKSEGCLHITCRCMFEFCYRCGREWDLCQSDCGS